MQHPAATGDPEGFEGWLARANQLKDDEDFGASAAAFARAIKLRPQSVEAWLGQAEAYFWQDRFEDSLELATRVTQFAPRSKEAWMAMADSLMKLQRTQAAVVAYQTVLEIDPNDQEAYQGLGVCYYELGNYQASLDATEQYLALLPDDADKSYPLVEKAKALVELGRLDEALEQYDEAIAISSTSAARLLKCRALFIKGEQAHEKKEPGLGRDEFLRLLEEQDLVEDGDRDANFWNLRGNTYSFLDDSAQALVAHQTALIFDPTNVNIKIATATDKYYLGQLKEAAQQMEECFKTTPSLGDDIATLEILSKIYGDLSAEEPNNRKYAKRSDKVEKQVRKLKAKIKPAKAAAVHVHRPRSPKKHHPVEVVDLVTPQTSQNPIETPDSADNGVTITFTTAPQIQPTYTIVRAESLPVDPAPAQLPRSHAHLPVLAKNPPPPTHPTTAQTPKMSSREFVVHNPTAASAAPATSRPKAKRKEAHPNGAPAKRRKLSQSGPVTSGSAGDKMEVEPTLSAGKSAAVPEPTDHTHSTQFPDNSSPVQGYMRNHSTNLPRNSGGLLEALASIDNPRAATWFKETVMQDVFDTQTRLQALVSLLNLCSKYPPLLGTILDSAFVKSARKLIGYERIQAKGQATEWLRHIRAHATDHSGLHAALDDVFEDILTICSDTLTADFSGPRLFVVTADKPGKVDLFCQQLAHQFSALLVVLSADVQKVDLALPPVATQAGVIQITSSAKATATEIGTSLARWFQPNRLLVCENRPGNIPEIRASIRYRRYQVVL